jgi:hypothetical protein
MQKNNFRTEIENLINSYDAVIVCSGTNSKTLLLEFAGSLKEYTAKVILVTTNEIETDTSIMNVSEEFMSGLLDYYYLYEFTDKIIVISDDSFCPDIKNYVSNGILTEEELIKSVLYKIG